jgi:plastocyanin
MTFMAASFGGPSIEVERWDHPAAVHHRGETMRRLSLALAVAGVLAVAATSAALAAAPSVVKISAPVSGLRYNQKVVHAHAGRIKIVFTNASALSHNVDVEHGETELGKTKTVTHGTTSIWVTLKPGKYNFYCSVPGHEDAGMHGTLVVSK